MVNHQFTTIRMKEDGLVVPVLSDAIDNVILTFLTTPGGRNWWDQTGYMFPNHDQVNELLSSPPSLSFNRIYAFLDYEGEFGSDGDNHRVNVGLQIPF